MTEKVFGIPSPQSALKISVDFYFFEILFLCPPPPIFVTCGQFHQHFTNSFYARRSQKCKKDSKVKHFFALLGSVHVKAALKHIDEIDPNWNGVNGSWGIEGKSSTSFFVFSLLLHFDNFFNAKIAFSLLCNPLNVT